MTIEATLEHIAHSLHIIANHLTHEPKAVELPAVVPAPVPVPAAPVPAPAPVPVPAPAAAPAPVPAAVPAAAGAPFTDSAGVMAYCMEKYKTLGPVKGGEIQQVLIGMGCNNIKALPADKFGEFYAKVEAL